MLLAVRQVQLGSYYFFLRGRLRLWTWRRLKGSAIEITRCRFNQRKYMTIKDSHVIGFQLLQSVSFELLDLRQRRYRLILATGYNR